MNTEIGANLKIEQESVPNGLRKLVPLICKWGFSNQREQDAFLGIIRRENLDELLCFCEQIDLHRSAVLEWGESMEQQMGVLEFCRNTPESYLAFLDAISVRDASGVEYHDPSVERMRKELLEEVRFDNYREASLQAEDAFKAGEYAVYIQLLNGFEDLLSKVQRRKLEKALNEVSQRS